MSTSDYVLNQASAGVASSDDYNQNLQDLEDTNLAQFGAGVVSGGTGTDGGGTTVNMADSVYLLGVKLSKPAAAVSVASATTTHIWAVTDPDDDDRVVYQTYTDATVPARATPLLTVVHNGTSITSITNHANRLSFDSLATIQTEIHNARGSLGTLDARLDVCLNEDGSLKSTATASILDQKASVRAATTANITLSGAQTIDGVSVIAGDRVLVKNQSTGSQNGIYVAAASTWSRATDMDASAEATAGIMIWVEEGTLNGDTGWLLTTNNPITLGTTSLSFTQVNTSPDGVTVEYSSARLQVKDLGISAAKLSAALQDLLPGMTITVGAESTDVIQVSVQYKDVAGNNLAERISALIWLGDSAQSTPSAVAPSGGWAVGAGYKVIDHTTNIVGRYVSDATGLLRIDITEAGSKTYYLHVEMLNRVYVSSAITFT